jgi:hypothetical protein
MFLFLISLRITMPGVPWREKKNQRQAKTLEAEAFAWYQFLVLLRSTETAIYLTTGPRHTETVCTDELIWSLEA